MRVVAAWTTALLAVVGIGVAVEAAAGVGAAFLVPGGEQSATIRIQLSGPGERPQFSGAIGGEALSGTYVPTDPSTISHLCRPSQSRHKPSPASGASFAYEGTFAGLPYSFSGCVTVPALTNLPPPPSSAVGLKKYEAELGKLFSHLRYEFAIGGHLGTQAMQGSADFTYPAQLLSPSPPSTVRINVPFSGTIGEERITGTATLTAGITGGGGLIVAHLTAG
jgi:hypothetical protein